MPIGLKDLNMALTFAESDLKANWRWYQQRYVEDISAHSVIPANAGIQEGTGFRVKPGMTNRKGLMSFPRMTQSCVSTTGRTVKESGFLSNQWSIFGSGRSSQNNGPGSRL